MSPLRALITIVQPQFFHLSALSVFLGSTMAFAERGAIDIATLVLALIAIAFIHAGVNSTNEYFDYVSGADLAVIEDTPFGGGTKVLPRGYLLPRTAIVTGIGAFAIGSAIGFVIVASTGIEVLVIGAIGVLLGYAYTAPPLKLAYRGLGEMFVGLAFGPLMVSGAYFIQTAGISFEVILMSLTPGLLNMAAIVCHRYPDFEPDKQAGKNTIVVKLGKEAGSRLFAFLLIIAYLPPLAGYLVEGVPAEVAIVGMLTLPLALPLAIRFLSGYSTAAIVNGTGRGTMRLLWIVPASLTVAYLLGSLLRA